MNLGALLEKLRCFLDSSNGVTQEAPKEGSMEILDHYEFWISLNER